MTGSLHSFIAAVALSLSTLTFAAGTWVSSSSKRLFILSFYPDRGNRPMDQELVLSFKNAGLVDDQGNWKGNSTVVLNGNFLADRDAASVLKLVTDLRGRGANIHLTLSSNDVRAFRFSDPGFSDVLKGSSLIRKVGDTLIVPQGSVLLIEKGTWYDGLQANFQAHLDEIAVFRGENNVEIWPPTELEQFFGKIGANPNIQTISTADLAAGNVKKADLDRLLATFDAKRIIISEEIFYDPNQSKTLYPDKVINLTPDPVMPPPARRGKKAGLVGVELGRGIHRSPILHENLSDPHAPSFQVRASRRRICAGTLGLFAVGLGGVGSLAYLATRPSRSQYVTPNPDKMTFEQACTHAGGIVPSVNGFSIKGACFCIDGRKILPFEGERCE